MKKNLNKMMVKYKKPNLVIYGKIHIGVKIKVIFPIQEKKLKWKI